MNLWQKWWDSAEASSSLVVALIGALVLMFQLRSFPAERRRTRVKAMEDEWRSTAAARGEVLRELPALFRVGCQAISARLDVVGDRSERGPESEHPMKVQRQSILWSASPNDVSYTSASEILNSEFKFRALMWSVETLRDAKALGRIGISSALLSSSRVLVDDLNRFALEYESGFFPPRIMLGQLHMSILRIAKALEPIIWEGKGIEGRWGRRILRMGLAAQHYNDVNKIHRGTNVGWKSDHHDLVIHRALTEQSFGTERVMKFAVKSEPYAQKILPLACLRARAVYWKVIGDLRLRPRLWWAYGGRRLRQHLKAEQKLGPMIQFAVGRFAKESSRASLNFDWRLGELPALMAEELARKNREDREPTLLSLG